MSLKRWLIIFAAALALTGAAIAGFNAVADPFGIFGDPVMDWWSYDMTQNPRTAKITYLDGHYEDYDAYIIGCSKTSSFPTEMLNSYYGASFYNLMMYGEDLYDVEMTLKYVLESYGAEQIVIVTGFEGLTDYDNESDGMKGNTHAKVDGSNPITFYSKYLFANPRYAFDKIEAWRNDSYLVNANRVFTVETGAYDKSLRDVERISSLKEYMAAYPEFTYDYGYHEALEDVDEGLASIGRMKAMCDAAGVGFTLIISPMYENDLDSYINDDLWYFYWELAEITDFWDFSGYNSVNTEPRYYYDVYHHRNSVGAMALARMFSDESVYVPEDFGVYVTAGNVEERIAGYTEKNGGGSVCDREVAVLMYHHIGDDTSSGTVVSEGTFRSQLKALKSAGYETVTFGDLIAYVDKGAELPGKPLVITFDDGYASNIEIAAPILAEYGMCATVNVIGVSEGDSYYKDTGTAIIPHFSFENALPWVEAGVIQIQSHSYDMHMHEKLDTENYRYGVLQKADESEEDYIRAFRQDFEASKSAIKEALGTEVSVYAYPYGAYNDLTEVLLSEMGVRVTLTVNEGLNTVIKGLPQSLRAMNRVNVTESYAGNALIEYLNSF